MKNLFMLSLVALLSWNISVANAEDPSIFLNRNVATHVGEQKGCHVTTATVPDPQSCQFYDVQGSHPIYLIGDSNADQFSDGLMNSAKSLKRSFFSFTGSSCPIMEHTQIIPPSQPEPFFGGGPSDLFSSHCDSYLTRAVSWLNSAYPGTVVIGQLDQYFWDPGFTFEYGKQTIRSEKDKVNHFLNNLKDTIRSFQAAGHKVLLIQSIPTWRNPAPGWAPSNCNQTQILANVCVYSLNLDFINSLQRKTRTAINSLGSQTNSKIIDFRNYFCDDRKCYSSKNGVNQYQDSTHINVLSSQNLSIFFTGKLKEDFK